MLRRKLFINQESGYLMIEIINEHVLAGYDCVLITGKLIPRNTPLHPSVQVDRIVPYNNTSRFKRILTWCVGSIQIFHKIVLYYRKEELFIVSNPPLAPLIPYLVKNPFSLFILDIFPDALVSKNIIRECSVINKLWKALNKKIYSKASNIYTLTETMGEVLQQYCKVKQPKVVSVWTDSALLKPITKDENAFIVRYGLQGKFIVMYSGNLGYTHNVEVLPEIAVRILNPDILFLIIGEGSSKIELLKRIKAFNLTNCLLLPWQPTSELPNSLAAADLAIVSSAGKASNHSIPSKTFNLMSVGAPLLCLSPIDSELDRLVKKHNNGKCFEHDKIEYIIDFINLVFSNFQYRKTLSDNSLKASLDYSPENAKLFLV